MPLDINMFRLHQGGEPEVIKESQRRRFEDPAKVDEVIALDQTWRDLINAGDALRRDRNAVQKQVAVKKKAKEACDDLVAQIKEFDFKIKENQALIEPAKDAMNKILNTIGNIVDDSVPVSQDEDNDTVIVRKWGEDKMRQFDSETMIYHHEILWRIGGYEPDRGVGVAGHRAYFLRDVGLLLNQALIAYGTAFLRKRNYCMLQPPFFMNKEAMAGVAQLEQFDEELYKVSGSDIDEKYLIATSEQPICGYHKDDWLNEKELPLRYGGISTCFRKEAGKTGKDTWGIFRVHQFEKVEQFVIVEGDLEKSKEMQEEMISTAEEFYQSLNLPYKVINIVSGDLNNAAIKKLDLEAWFPGYNQYRELVSCSNCTDYQSRSMEIRSGVKKMGDQSKKYVHMLNATLCATTRTICCILENYQTDGGVNVPEVLVPFMGGLTFLPYVRESKFDVKADVPNNKNKQKNQEKGRKENSTKAPAPPPSSSSSSSSSVTPPAPPTGEAAALIANITEAGKVVRDLKTAKAAPDAITEAVQKLLSAKQEYKDKIGEDYIAPGTQGNSKDKKKQKNKEKDNKNSNTPAGSTGGIEKEKRKGKENEKTKEKPALTSTTKSSSTPTSTSTFASTTKAASGGLNLSALNDKLLTYSYLNGFTPTKEDAMTFNKLSSNSDENLFEDLQRYNNVMRWFNHMSSFTPGERASW